MGKLTLLLVLLLVRPASVPILPNSVMEYFVQHEKPYLEFEETVLITGYSSRKCETDDTPFQTATLDSVQIGCIALSQDLIAKYGYYNFVVIPGFNEPFLVLDTMHKRFKNRADIWWPKTLLAYNFGSRRLKVTIIVPNQNEIDELYLCNKKFPVRRTKRRCQVLASNWSGRRG